MTEAASVQCSTLVYSSSQCDNPFTEGANIIVAGSAVFKGNVEQNVQDFLTLMK